MIAAAGTDRAGPLYIGWSDSQYRHVFVARRGFMLVCLLIATSFAVAVVSVRLFRSDEPAIAVTQQIAAPAAPAVSPARAVSASETSGTLHGVIRNPAIQKSGPPDPATERSAAASADGAARAAADLAARGN